LEVNMAVIEKREADFVESDNVQLESGIIGDEPTEREGNCCGRIWKRITYELTPSPNALIVVFSGAVAILLELGIYLAVPHCPPMNCSVPLESLAAISPIGFGGALLFAGMTKGMCVFADMAAGKRKVGKSEADRLVPEHVALEEGIVGDEPTESCCKRTWKCITNEVQPSPNILIAVSAGGMAFLLGMGVYLVYPRCPPTSCSVPEKSYGLTSLIGFGGALISAVLTKVACVYSDTVAGIRRSCCRPS
jgi:hypothetical protein